VFRNEPALHPEDRETDESGPWLPILVASAVAWLALFALDYRLLSEGTFLWATIKSLYTLILAPLAAAALLQDTRYLGVEGVEVGPAKWAYALVAVIVPPVGAVYLGHRYWLVSNSPVDLDTASEDDDESADATDDTTPASPDADE
jgi:hypothetical protein